MGYCPGPTAPSAAGRARWPAAVGSRVSRYSSASAGTSRDPRRALFGPKVWDAAYERALGWHTFAAWTAVHKADEWSYPLWVNLGRPLLDEPGSIDYLHETPRSS